MRLHTPLVLLASVALVASLAACGVNEESKTAEPGAVWIEADIAGADLDGNARTDIVTVAALQTAAGESTGYVKVYRQSVTGAFTSTQYQVGRHPWRVRIADIDVDGAPDLLVLDVVSAATVGDDVLYVLLQDANNRGQFLAPRVLASGFAASDFVVTDVNLDTFPDIVIAGVAGGGTGATQLLHSATQRGAFRPPTVLPIAGRVQVLATGDVGATGRADLASYAVLDSSASANAPGQLLVNYASVLSGVTGSGFYLMPGTVLASQVGVTAQHLSVADVDADAREDLVVAFAPISASFEPKVSVALQRLVGEPEIVDTSLAGLSGLDSFVVADLNDNGVPDLATTGTFAVGTAGAIRSRTNLLAPTAGGRYLPFAAIDMPVPMSRIGAADVDGDGLVDLLLLGDRHRAFVMFQSGSPRGTFFAPREL